VTPHNREVVQPLHHLRPRINALIVGIVVLLALLPTVAMAQALTCTQTAIAGGGFRLECKPVAATATRTPTPTKTPTATATATQIPPTATATLMPPPTATATAVPPMPVTGARVNVPLTEALPGDPALNYNNYSVVWLGKVVDSTYTDVRLLGAADGLRVRLQFIDSQPTAADAITLKIGDWTRTVRYGDAGTAARGSDADGYRGWDATLIVPWADLGGRPADGTVLPMRIERGGYQWAGDLHWGLPEYQVAAAGNVRTLTAPIVADTMVGGGTDCGYPDWPQYFPTWGTRNWGSSPYLLTQNQGDIADWPCYAKIALAWDQAALPAGAQVVSATLILRHFGDPGYGSGYDPDGSGETTHQVYELPATWDEMTVGWDTLPAVGENVSRGVIKPVPDTCIVNDRRYCDPPLVETLDVTALAQRAGQGRASAAVYTAAGQYHSGKQLWSRESTWPPQVRIAYVLPSEPPAATATATPAPTSVATATNPPVAATPTATATTAPTATPRPTASPTPVATRPPAPTEGRTYYIAPDGRDTGAGSEIAPWATFERAWRTLQPGDTLVLLDGTYRQSLMPSISGTASAPITVRALNDGQAIIDGEFKRTPVEFGHSRPGQGHNFVIEGIVARNSDGDVWFIRSDNVKLRRVSGYNASVDDNSSIFTFWTRGGGLLEDCLASGTGRKMILLYQSDNVTVRRCFTRWQQWDGRDFCGVLWPNAETVQVYNGNGNTFENIVATGPSPVWLIAVQSNSDAAIANNNRVLGSIAAGAGMDNGTAYNYGARPTPTTCGDMVRSFDWPNQRAGVMLWGQGTMQNNTFRDVLTTGNAALGFSNDKPYGPGATGTIVDRLTAYGNGAYAPYGDGGPGTQAKLNGIVPTNSCIGAVTCSAGGARLTNRYIDGVLTTIPVLPWDMEQRGRDELGISISYIWRGYANR
jgi:hypothetical protein